MVRYLFKTLPDSVRVFYFHYMAKLQLSLRARIFFSMNILIVITFVLTGAVLIYHFQREEEEYHKERLKRKEYAVRSTIDYFLRPYKEGLTEKELPEMFSDKICEIADIHNLDVALYSTSGYLLIASSEEIVDRGIVPLRLNPTTLYQVLNQNQRLKVNYTDSVEYLSSYSVVYNKNNKPLAVVSLPYYYEANTLPAQDVQFMRALGSIYILLFVSAVIIAYLLSNYITGSLRTIGERLKEIRLNRRNEEISWNSNDEIGDLVAEFNRMVSDLEQSAVLLARSERESAWKEMARQVAHEIKNPLTPMRLMVQYMDKTLKTEEPEKLHEHTQAMIDQIDAMSSIAEAFSRFADMPEYKKDRIDLNQLLTTCTTLYPSLKVDFKGPGKAVFAFADRELMVRVINNLIKNAQQAIPENQEPHIELGLKEQKNSILLWVKDNGSGIEAEQQEKIFEPSFTTKSQGMGMGLAIVKAIVEGHGGKIWLESFPQKGATFFIELPLPNTVKI